MSESMRGLRVLITGATDGIGRLTAAALASQGAKLVVHGRSRAKLDDTIAALAKTGAEVVGVLADLASLEQTARLADDVAALEPELDVVIHNAGVGFGSDRQKRETSDDGFERVFAVNFLAPFLLSEALFARGLPRRAAIYLASAGQEALDLDDWSLEKSYNGVVAYRRSKLALVMLAFDEAELHPGVVCHALHPGTFLATNMVIEAGIEPAGPPGRGADATLAVLRAALAGGDSGRYFDETRPAKANAEAYDREMRSRLRGLALELTSPFRAAR